VLYMLVVWISLVAVPLSELTGSTAPLALVFERVTGASPKIMSSVAMVATLNGVIVYAGRGNVSLFHLNLGLAYDFRIVSDDTAFVNPNVDIGLITKGSGYFMPRMLGVRKAAEVLQWKSFSPEDALQLGLVDRIVPAAKLEEETMRFVAANLEGSTATLLGIRKLLKCDLKELERSLQMEDQLIKERLESQDFRQTFSSYCSKTFGCDMETLRATG